MIVGRVCIRLTALNRNINVAKVGLAANLLTINRDQSIYRSFLHPRIVSDNIERWFQDLTQTHAALIGTLDFGSNINCSLTLGCLLLVSQLQRVNI